jgi:hypothetical protein
MVKLFVMKKLYMNGIMKSFTNNHQIFKCMRLIPLITNYKIYQSIFYRSIMPQCSAMTRDGNRCRRHANSSGLCSSHCQYGGNGSGPSVEEQMAAYRARHSARSAIEKVARQEKQRQERLAQDLVIAKQLQEKQKQEEERLSRQRAQRAERQLVERQRVQRVERLRAQRAERQRAEHGRRYQQDEDPYDTYQSGDVRPPDRPYTEQLLPYPPSEEDMDEETRLAMEMSMAPAPAPGPATSVTAKQLGDVFRQRDKEKYILYGHEPVSLEGDEYGDVYGDAYGDAYGDENGDENEDEEGAEDEDGSR